MTPAFIRFVDGDYTRYLRDWAFGNDVATVLVPMAEMASLSNVGRLPSYTQAPGMQKALR